MYNIITGVFINTFEFGLSILTFLSILFLSLNMLHNQKFIGGFKY